MPIGFKGFKALGRRKSNTPANESSNPSSPIDGQYSSFRVIPRGSATQNNNVAPLDKPLPTLAHRQTWSEEENSASNRASDSTSSTTYSRYHISEKSHEPEKATQYNTSRYNLEKRQKGSSLAQAPFITEGALAMPVSDSSEDFGNMFKMSANAESVQTSFRGEGVTSDVLTKSDQDAAYPNNGSSIQYSRYTKTPPPLHLRKSGDFNPSPYSMQSRTSHDGLLSSATPSPTREKPPPPPQHGSSPKKSHTYNVMRNTISSRSSDISGHDIWDQNVVTRRDSTESFTRSGAEGDTDARMVRNSVLARRDTHGLPLTGQSSLRHSLVEPHQASLQPSPHISQTVPSDTSTTAPSSSSSASTNGHRHTGITDSLEQTTPTINGPIPPSNHTTPRGNPAQQYEVDSDSDDEPLAHTLHRISSNPRLSTIPAPSDNGSRLSMMSSDNPKRRSTFDNLRSISGTAADFSSPMNELRALNDVDQALTLPRHEFRSADDDSSYSDQRPRLSIASQSAPLLPTSHARAISNITKSSDDDDDVPLALLPANNSPMRGRTPDPRFSQQSFMGEGRPGGGLGAPGTMVGRPHSSLPPFARRLPQDPYHSGASMMGASRESLMLNRHGPMFPPGQSPVPGIPPGGLVGVIAEEERSKSWRRAGGQAQIGPTSLMAGMSMGMGGPTSIPGLGNGLMNPQMMSGMQAAEQTQFNQQLVQLVQQQSIMLQQMQAMMLQQNHVAQSVVGYAEPEFGHQSPGSPGLRPMSIMESSQRTRSMVNLSRPGAAPRTMSMVNTSSPYAPNWTMASEPLISSATSIRGMADGYAPSVAPSERSTIGQPNRYRPVTNSALAPDNQSSYGGYNRTSMANPPRLPPLGIGRDEDPASKKKRSGFFQAMIHPRGSRNSELIVEDEEDWGKFARKRRSAMPS